MEHSCLVIRPRDTDYVFGANSPIVLRSVSNDWLSHLKFFEWQKYGWETDSCVLFSAQESFDAQMDALIMDGKVPQSAVQQFYQMGFMDTNSLDGQAHFHSSPRFLAVLTGNGQNGNALTDPWDVMRKYGVLPWHDLPFDETTTVQQYFAAIPQPLLDKAALFLSIIGGKNAIQYHWIFNGTENTAALNTALLTAPVCLGTPVCEPWDQATPPTCSGQPSAHSTLCYQVSAQGDLILDHYVPFEKILTPSYPVPYALQGILNPTFPAIPLPPVPVNVQPTQQNANLLSSIVALYKQLVSLVLGPKVGSESNPMNYSILKSRTFWTIVFMFVFNGYTAIAGQLPGGSDLIVNALLSALASYFHLQTGQSTSGTN